ncbi:MAG: S49 family peptidase [Rhodospirillales bacterium]|nr:S49 family peptidase [Alphaproteobacteria bacterium]MBL6947451.1 S49 family peptidase [Rhodospirillales bacterium]
MKDFPAIPFLGNPAPVVGVIRLDGVIGRMGPIYRGLTLAALADSLERAFRLRHLKAVALAINSPGGSAVQSSLIAGRIRDLADEHDVPVYAFAEDVAASGGYWLALAADEIYADGNSIIGSIGVVSSGFGFTELIKRIGVERRLHTAGDKKAMLDPFSPEKPADVRHLKDLQKDIHENFTAMVRDRRGDKLKADDKKLFSGAFWTGPRALEMGLIDGIGDLRSEMRLRFGEKVKLKLVGGRKPFWRRRLSLAQASGMGHAPRDWSGDWAARALAAIEERMIWNRFGL